MNVVLVIMILQMTVYRIAQVPGEAMKLMQMMMGFVMILMIV
jgi:hypothetical protein